MGKIPLATATTWLIFFYKKADLKRTATIYNPTRKM